MSDSRFLVMIPAYNEEDSIAEVVQKAQRYAEVLVVDDCSTDRTPEILAGIDDVFLIRHERNTHIGGAVLDGMRFALAGDYDYVISMDAGLSHDPNELPRFVEAPPCDLLIGARAPDEERNKPLYREALSRAGSLMMNFALYRAGKDRPRWLSDCTSGYRRYSRHAMEVIVATPLQSRAFDFLLETLAVICRAGCSIREVPISYEFSNSSLNGTAVWEALRTWYRLCRG